MNPRGVRLHSFGGKSTVIVLLEKTGSPSLPGHSKNVEFVPIVLQLRETFKSTGKPTHVHTFKILYIIQ